MESARGRVISKRVFDEIKSHLIKQVEKGFEFFDHKEVAGWFMGTRGENITEVSGIITSALVDMLISRRELFPKDPNYITEDVKSSVGYKRGIQSVIDQSQHLLRLLNKYSLPMYSLRYQGHMTWDITLPSMVGYFAAMLQNQNNVTPQASPATTVLELLVCNDIANMAGFTIQPIDDDSGDKDTIYAWSHLSCDGTVANIESMWAARELKFFPLGIKYALNKGQYLEDLVDTLKIPGEDRLYRDATAWELLNLRQDQILDLPEQICEQKQRTGPQTTISDVWKNLTDGYSLNARGINFFESQYLEKEYICPPCVIVPSTKHYSWIKAASLLGIGHGQKGLKEKELVNIDVIKNDGLINVYVDPEGKVKTDLLNGVLRTCKENKKPVVMVVGVMGTTEEGAVDPLEKILQQREQFRNDATGSFEYVIHADAAWGGYFLSCFRKPFEMEKQDKGDRFENQHNWFRDSVYTSMTKIPECDSVTIDPHKMGYIPYPAGTLTYKNGKIVNLLTFSAPYISSGHSGSGSGGSGINTRNIGECGIEGSKSGAAAACVYLSHMVIRPDRRGHGKIVNQSMLNSKLFYLYLGSLKHKHPKDKFEVVMFNEPETDLAAYQKLLWESDLNTEDGSNQLFEVLKNIAGDQNIIDYIFVDKKDRSSVRTQELNNRVFEKLTLEPGQPVEEQDIFVSKTTFHRNEYGDDFMNTLARRVYQGCEDPNNIEQIPCIRSVIMDPWAIFTHAGKRHNFFVEIFIPRLREVVNGLCKK